ncbi:MAG TPA: hypothetical protein ENH82_16605 [bacterium]|nr:hypothetical protein [bacterium]
MGANVTIQLDEAGESKVISTTEPGGVEITTTQIPTIGSIQDIWDTLSSGDKNTFADANRTEILTFIDVLLMTELTDGASIAADCLSEDQIMFYLSTAQGTPTITFSNFGNVCSVAIAKTIAGDVVVTLAGTGLKFVDLDSDNDTIATTIDITLSGGADSHYEISLIDSGIDDAGSNVLNVTSKL